MTPHVSVIIATYQQPHLLRRCLQALAEQTLPLLSFEVIVVDDADDPRTALAVRQIAQQTDLTVRYLTQPTRRGLAAARNRGWRVALAPVIAFTHASCQPGRTWLSAALTRTEQAVDVLAGGLVDSATPSLTTANLFCRRAVLDAVGGFDEAFTNTTRADRDLEFKLIRAGIRIEPYPEAAVLPDLQRPPWYAPLRDERTCRYDALLYKRHPQLFRQHRPTQVSLVRRHYLSIIALMGGAVGLLLGQPQVGLIGLAVWTALTLLLFLERRPQSMTPVAVGQTVVTSIATPFLSVYWRLHGAVKYRAWYW